ncbi:hypothetical protein [uncultured Gemmiger sp.]|uniref:hypothetical protein n=1 Tax=uncultured Gemmiger sp. TaxID=1623490 RepID=UPI0026014FCE|nr:hypothetical protein [uncultured Gemmiger sp.]
MKKIGISRAGSRTAQVLFAVWLPFAADRTGRMQQMKATGAKKVRRSGNELANGCQKHMETQKMKRKCKKVMAEFWTIFR